jgi:hypothetical protein
MRRYREKGGKEKAREYCRKNEDRIKRQKERYYQENREYFLTLAKEYHKNNKDEIKEKRKDYHKQHYRENKERYLEQHKRYQERNKNKIREYQREWHRVRYETDPKYRLSIIIRGHLRRLGRRLAMKELNYTAGDLQRHIEKQLTEEMKERGYHIDHHVPLSSFKRNTIGSMLAESLYNLRPLLSRDNLSKQNKLPDDHIKHLIGLVSRVAFLKGNIKCMN